MVKTIFSINICYKCWRFELHSKSGRRSNAFPGKHFLLTSTSLYSCPIPNKGKYGQVDDDDKLIIIINLKHFEDSDISLSC